MGVYAKLDRNGFLVTDDAKEENDSDSSKAEVRILRIFSEISENVTEKLTRKGGQSDKMDKNVTELGCRVQTESEKSERW